MVLEAAQAHAMGWVAVVQARVAGFDAVEIAVEGGDFYADFGDKVAGEVGGKGRWVVRGRTREEVIVEQVGDGGLTTHGDGVCGAVDRRQRGRASSRGGRQSAARRSGQRVEGGRRRVATGVLLVVVSVLVMK